MNRGHAGRIFLLINILTSFQWVLGQNLLDLEHSIPYTYQLIKLGKHQEARQEIQRLKRNYPFQDTLVYMDIYNALEGDDPKELFRLIRIEIGRMERKAYLNRFLVEQAFIHDSVDLASEAMNSIQGEDELKDILRFHVHLYHLDTFQAKALMNRTISLKGTYCSDVTMLYNQAVAIQYKKAINGALLSLVIPGSGKVYAKQPKNGLASLSITGLFAFQAWRGFSMKGVDSYYGWFFGLAGLVFYAGNVYGSYYAVERYNHVMLTDLRYEIKKSLTCYIY